MPPDNICTKKNERIPRPRNAFMIFRSEFWAAEKINPVVEHDHRHISRIIGHCWNQMPQHEKLVWFLKAEEEKVAHMRKYPDYRFTPLSRIKKPVKRNVKRNCEDEMRRCRLVANLLLAGKEGDELTTAVNETDSQGEPQFHSMGSPKSRLGNSQIAPIAYLANPPPFRSPLLPPSSLPESTSSKVALVPYTEYYPFSRHGDTMSEATPLRNAHTAVGRNTQTGIPSSYLKYQCSPEQIHDPTPSKTPTYPYSSIPSNYHHYDNASHSYPSAYVQSPHPHQLTSPDAESNARTLQRDISNDSTECFHFTPAYPESTMHTGSSCIRFNNPFDPNTAFPLQYNHPSPVDPLQPDPPVGYRRWY